eukprot:222606-Rhodomonas_salina.4
MATGLEVRVRAKVAEALPSLGQLEELFLVDRQEEEEERKERRSSAATGGHGRMACSCVSGEHRTGRAGAAADGGGDLSSEGGSELLLLVRRRRRRSGVVGQEISSPRRSPTRTAGRCHPLGSRLQPPRARARMSRTRRLQRCRR